MSRFKLSGLLRARVAQEEQARRGLGTAQARLSAAGAVVHRREAELAAAGLPPDGHAPVFLAGLAARSSIAASVTEATALREAFAQEVGQARSEWLQARMRSRAVERLAERDRLERQAERGRAEQLLSDDLAASRHDGNRRAEDSDQPEGRR